jgi:hypothetical protein
VVQVCLEESWGSRMSYLRKDIGLTMRGSALVVVEGWMEFLRSMSGRGESFVNAMRYVLLIATRT